MAGNLGTISRFAKGMVDFIQPILQDVINSEVEILRIMNKDTKKERWHGKYYEFPVILEPGEGIGNRAENTALPTADTSKIDRTQIDAVSIYGRVKFTAEMMESGTAFRQQKDLVKTELEKLKERFKVDMARQLFTGPRGDMAVVSHTGTTAVATITVDSTIPATKYLRKGMRVQFYNTSTDSAAGGNSYYDIKRVVSATQIVVSPTIVPNSIDNTVVVRQGNYNGELNGLKVACDDGTYGPNNTFENIDGDVYERWNATVNQQASPSTLSVQDIDKMVDDIFEASGQEPDVVVMSRKKRREFVHLFDAELRYGAVFEKTGFSANLQYVAGDTTLAIETSRHCPDDKIFFLKRDVFTFAEKVPGEWLPGWKDGIFERDTTNDTNAWQATFWFYGNLVCHQRNVLGLLHE